MIKYDNFLQIKSTINYDGFLQVYILYFLMSEKKPSKSELSSPDKTPLEFEMILDGVMDQSEIYRKDEDVVPSEEL